MNRELRLAAAGLMAIAVFNLLVFPAFPRWFGLEAMPARIPDLWLYYTPDQLRGILAALGPAGRRVWFFSTLWADTIYPIIYSTTLSLLLKLAHEKARPRRLPRAVIHLPVAIAAADYLENIGGQIANVNWPAPPAWALWLASLATPLKWAMALLTAVALLGLAARALTAAPAPRR